MAQLRIRLQFRDPGSTPGLEKSPGEENSNPLQYSCPGNPVERGDWWATVHSVTKESDMTGSQKSQT